MVKNGNGHLDQISPDPFRNIKIERNTNGQSSCRIFYIIALAAGMVIYFVPFSIDGAVRVVIVAVVTACVCVCGMPFSFLANF